MDIRKKMVRTLLSIYYYITFFYSDSKTVESNRDENNIEKGLKSFFVPSYDFVSLGF